MSGADAIFEKQDSLSVQRVYSGGVVFHICSVTGSSPYAFKFSDEIRPWVIEGLGLGQVLFDDNLESIISSIECRYSICFVRG